MPGPEEISISIGALVGVLGAFGSALTYLYYLINLVRKEAKIDDEAVRASFGRALDRMDRIAEGQRKEMLEEMKDIYRKIDEASDNALRRHEQLIDRMDSLGRVVVTLPTRAEMKADGTEREDRLREEIRNHSGTGN